MTIRKLPLLNLAGRKSRSAALLVFSLFLSCSLFGGSVVLMSLRQGLRSLELRLGADIIVAPESAYVKKGVENILLYGNRTYFYMPKGRLDDIAAIDGVELVSPQMFLATLSSGCCSVGLQIIGFDEGSDFTVRPWLSRDFRGTLGDGDIIVGSKIEMPTSGTLRFYGTDCRIVAQLRETGTGLDNAVYTSLPTIKKLIAASVAMGFNDKLVGNPDKSISSVMVKVKDGYDVNDVARQIDRHVKQVKAVRTKSMTSGISDSLAGVSRMVAFLVAVVWLLCLVVMAVVFGMIASERKKEFAVLRAVGASRKKLARLVLSEAVIVTSAGAVLGIAAASLCIFPFHALLAQSLSLPFLLPGVPVILVTALVVLAVSVAAGAAASSASAMRIARTDTGMILREGN